MSYFQITLVLKKSKGSRNELLSCSHSYDSPILDWHNQITYVFLRHRFYQPMSIFQQAFKNMQLSIRYILPTNKDWMCYFTINVCREHQVYMPISFVLNFPEMKRKKTTIIKFYYEDNRLLATFVCQIDFF